MQIFLSADHAGFFLKEKVKGDLISRGFLVEDFGAKDFNGEDNFPDYIYPCVKTYMQKTSGDVRRGIAIVFGGSGTGEAILANKMRGVRAVAYNGNSLEIVKLGRMHNNANVLSIGARFVEEKEAIEAVKIFMTTAFEGGRHVKRVLALDML
jgi:ribose 5-phosphate isomerase B